MATVCRRRLAFDPPSAPPLKPFIRLKNGFRDRKPRLGPRAKAFFGLQSSLILFRAGDLPAHLAMKPFVLCPPFTRVLTLDFDGVLHGADDGEAVFEGGWMRIVGAGLFRWCDVLVEMLEHHPDVALAAHTSWRNHHDDQELKDLLPAALRHRFLGATLRGLSREESILFLVQELGSHPCVALDDDADAFPAGFEGLILCDGALGLTDPKAASALAQWLHDTAPALTSAKENPKPRS
jgi:hypothetical protein